MKHTYQAGTLGSFPRNWWLALVLAGLWLFSGAVAWAQPRESLAGEQAAQQLKQSIVGDATNIMWGPVRFKTSAQVGVGYTDNLFLSEHNRADDVVINPQVTLDGLWPVTELNTLRFGVGLGYEYYTKNHELNSSAPLVSPTSELVFNIFAGDFRIRLRNNFSYQETLFFENFNPDNPRFLNLVDVTKFKRIDNIAGFNVDWDLNKALLNLGYDHENFISETEQFNYLSRASEWITASAALRVGDHASVGVEGQGSYHSYYYENPLFDNWRERVGPFMEATFMDGVSFRTGGGYDTAQFFDLPPSAENSDYHNYYAYGRVSQKLRLFTHSLTAAHETVLGDNANNLRNTYVVYAIDTPIVRHFDIGGSASVNDGKEFGGTFNEEFIYYVLGVHATWNFAQHWHTGLAYTYVYKGSDVPNREFNRNQVTWNLAFTF